MCLSSARTERGPVAEDSIRRYAHYATGQLERLLQGLERLYGDEPPAFIDEIRGELERRRVEARSAEPGTPTRPPPQ
jgi:hypothetical protein